MSESLCARCVALKERVAELEQERAAVIACLNIAGDSIVHRALTDAGLLIGIGDEPLCATCRDTGWVCDEHGVGACQPCVAIDGSLSGCPGCDHDRYLDEIVDRLAAEWDEVGWRLADSWLTLLRVCG